MKCKNCGANYRAKEEKCPYCGTANPRGLRWKQEKQAAEAEYARVSSEEAPLLRLRAANRVLNRVLIAEAALFALAFLGVIAAFFLTDAAHKAGNRLNETKIEAEIETLYASEQFGVLYEMMDKKDLFGQEHYEASQMVLLYSQYERFEEARLNLFRAAEENDVDENEITWLIGRMNDVLNADIPAYPELTEQNRAHVEEYRADVLAFAEAMLGMTEQERAVLQQDYIPMDEENTLAAAVLERRAWK